MLHIAIPPCKKNGRQIIHGPDFKKAENSLPYIKQWHAWEKNDMHKIIRSLKRKKDEKISYHF
jgi:alpha-N-acetylglucosamine transferase